MNIEINLLLRFINTKVFTKTEISVWNANFILKANLLKKIVQIQAKSVVMVTSRSKRKIWFMFLMQISEGNKKSFGKRAKAWPTFSYPYHSFQVEKHFTHKISGEGVYDGFFFWQKTNKNWTFWSFFAGHKLKV